MERHGLLWNFMESFSGKLRVLMEPYTTPEKHVQAHTSLETLKAPFYILFEFQRTSDILLISFERPYRTL